MNVFGAGFSVFGIYFFVYYADFVSFKRSLGPCEERVFCVGSASIHLF